MKMSFRWYGRGNDPIPLEYVKQIPGVSNIVWALHHKAAGEEWELDEINDEINYIKSFGFNGDVVESVNVHEEIKTGGPSRDLYINHYINTIKNLGSVGVKVICYNFMPIFDWTRTDLFHPLPDGSTSLFFEKNKLEDLDPYDLIKMFEENSNNLTLPGWEPERIRKIKEMFEVYENITEEDLRGNLKYFLEAIIPTCEEVGIKMAIHPDDPPFSIFNLPRLVNNEENIEKILALVNSQSHGLTFCTGSLGADPDNNLVQMIRRFHEHIYFSHLRNVKVYDNGNFAEVSHRSSDGSVDITEIMKIHNELNYQGYIRPDHGRHVFGEGENCRPGYGLYDRAMGIMYLYGSWDMAEKFKNSNGGNKSYANENSCIKK
ncbi:mannonate dehydratase [Bacillus sp. MRMR6]|uniref:mannonate dehydratase n=1 Tax=Bacillus sp. MRMR6 TaxID=1928617 RepID=UPI000951A477|nr:mannonate dehydratase [Bacillus sp. MRMR6]OLS33494.1 mannonate dehydratase [Bacillus sp. MRMR6]